jgi:cellulose synthase/poly-beta-1,6-N-acetylglucosamine synthase-like glycosyltransferase
MIVSAFAVGVPARDEARRVAAAIESLDDAAHHTTAPVHLVVVADRCRDRTAQVAAAAFERTRWLASTTVVERDLANVGAARDLACRLALAASSANGAGGAAADGAAADDVTSRWTSRWVATTDADTTVPPHWFRVQALWSARGVEGVAGLVELDPTDPLPANVRRRWARHVDSIGAGHGHPHVHGANLALRADHWLAAGGFAHCTVGEDHELWRRASAAGARLVGTDDIVVRTSARTIGRAEGGFADSLRDLA